MTGAVSVLVVATSYPRSEDDWQGLFIRRLVEAMAREPLLQTAIWAAPGPIPAGVISSATEADGRFLLELADQGGIAHKLRTRPLAGLGDASRLLRRLGALYERDSSDILHINWLQNALPLGRRGRRAVIPVLGTDFGLVKLPGMVQALRRVLRHNHCVLAPNAPWMEAPLKRQFGDLCEIVPVNFGIDEHWFGEPNPDAAAEPRSWLCVTRVTRPKLGTLLDWGGRVFSRKRPLDLIGPNQEGLALPDWIRHHGHATPEDLRRRWFPRARGLISLSSHSEGRPQVMLEAMAAGLPIVASKLPAHESTVKHGETGYLVASARELEEAVRALEAPDTACRCGRAARRVAREDFGTWSDAVARYRALYSKLLDAQG